MVPIDPPMSMFSLLFRRLAAICWAAAQRLIFEVLSIFPIMAEHDDQLAALRREIDSVDTQLHDLLMQRTELAVKVGEVKAKAQPIGRTPSEGSKFVRPAREAKILRRLI